MLTDVTSCGTYGALDMQVQLDFYVGTDQDFELAERLIAEAVMTSRYAYLDKPVVVRIRQVVQDNCVAIHLRGKAYVLDTKYEKAFETDVSKTVLRAFREHGILPPAVLHRSIDATARLSASRTAPRRTSEFPSQNAQPCGDKGETGDGRGLMCEGPRAEGLKKSRRHVGAFPMTEPFDASPLPHHRLRAYGVAVKRLVAVSERVFEIACYVIRPCAPSSPRASTAPRVPVELRARTRRAPTRWRGARWWKRWPQPKSRR